MGSFLGYTSGSGENDQSVNNSSSISNSRNIDLVEQQFLVVYLTLLRFTMSVLGQRALNRSVLLLVTVPILAMEFVR